MNAIGKRLSLLEAEAFRREMEVFGRLFERATLEEAEAVACALRWELALRCKMGPEADDLPGLLARTREELGLPDLTMEEAPRVVRELGDAAWGAVLQRPLLAER